VSNSASPALTKWQIAVIFGLAFAGIFAACRSHLSLSEALSRQQAEDHVPGLVAIATRSGSIIESAASGIERIGYNSPVAVNDRFHLGSNTKAMTATLMAILVEQGKLSWSTRIPDTFPDWTQEMNAAYRDVTLTDLLSHRAGIPEYSNFSYLFTDDPIHRDDGSQHSEEDRRDWAEMTSLRGAPMEARRQFAGNVLRRSPSVPSHSRFLYSNAGYAIAAAMAERVTGKSWEQLMQDLLFTPLGIQALYDWPAVDDPHQPWGHFQLKSILQPHDPRGPYHLPSCLAPAGGISMSAPDYAKFLQLHLQGLMGHDGLLKADTIRILHSWPAASDPRQPSYAYGWALIPYEGEPSSWHEGSAGTFYTGVALLPRRNLAVAVLANVGVRKAHDSGMALLKWMINHYK
jgi:D-alanyl-D-alanine carboxypeptidase